MELITAKRPDWSAVPAWQLKTDFAKAVLARLLEQAAEPVTATPNTAKSGDKRRGEE